MKYELTDLEIFLSLAHTLNIAATAQEVCRTPSAVGVRLKKLESALDVVLFRRHSRGLELTNAGLRLQKRARLVMEDIRGLEQHLRPFREHARCVLRIATNSTFLQTTLTKIVSRYLVNHRVRFVFNEVQTEAGIRLLHNGVVDCVFGRENILERPSFGLKVIPLCVDRHVLITPVRHPLTQQERVRFIDTLDYPHIALPRTTAIGSAMYDRCQRVNLAFEPIVQVPTFASAIELVACGAGVSVVPKSALTSNDQVAIVNLDDMWAYRPMGLGYLAENYIPGNEFDFFMQFVKAYFQEEYMH